MLFVSLLTSKPGSVFQENLAKRLQWEYPAGVQVVAEYWLETESPRVISVVEAENADAFGQIRMDWNEAFEIEIFPAITAEHGMDLARQAMS